MLQGEHVVQTVNMKRYKSEVYYLERLPLYQHTKPYFLSLPVNALPQIPQSNHCHALCTVEVSDVRGRAVDFTLDVNGFEFIQHTLRPSFTYSDLKFDEALRKEYQSDVAGLLKRKLGAKDVIVFDDSLRKRNIEFPNAPGEESAMNQPIRAVHVDSSPNGAIQRALAIQKLRRGQENELGRISIVNVWRPLISPLNDWPLAVCDARSLDEESDLISSDTVFPGGKTAETLQVFHNVNHQWHFISGQTRDEPLLFKIYDSLETVAGYCPHVSFDYAACRNEQARERESIEVRAVVFH